MTKPSKNQPKNTPILNFSPHTIPQILNRLIKFPNFTLILKLLIYMSILFMATYSGYYYSTHINPLSNTPDSPIPPTTTNKKPASSSKPRPSPNLTLEPITTSTPTKGQIAYIEANHIWTIYPDRSSPQQLTNDNSLKFSLTPSPDGKHIAYIFVPQELTNPNPTNIHAGYKGGIAILNLATNNTTELIPAGINQHTYPQWSPDSQFLTVWIGNGLKTTVYNINTGQEILSYESSQTTGTSPITWVPNHDLISLISNQELFTASPSGQNAVSLSRGVDAYSIAHEAPNLPHTPIWSPKGTYVTYFKSDNLYLYNTINQNETLIQTAKTPNYPDFYDQYIGAEPITFSQNEKYLYLEKNDQIKNLVVYNTDLNTQTELQSYRSRYYSHKNPYLLIKTDHQIHAIDTETNQTKPCFSENPNHRSRTFNHSWSSNNRWLIIHKSQPPNTLTILDIDTCNSYDLLKTTNSINDAAWIPKAETL